MRQCMEIRHLSLSGQDLELNAIVILLAAFVLYLKITGPYASEGVLQKKIRKIYRKFQQDAKIPGDAYCVRIKITHDEEGNDWNYLKIYILLKPES